MLTRSIGDVIFGHNVLKEIQALFTSGTRESGKRSLRRGDGSIDILCPAKGDARKNVFRCRVNDIDEIELKWSNPHAIDVMLAFMPHRRTHSKAPFYQ
jgi:hypothetical protein